MFDGRRHTDTPRERDLSTHEGSVWVHESLDSPTHVGELPQRDARFVLGVVKRPRPRVVNALEPSKAKIDVPIQASRGLGRERVVGV